MRVYLSYPIILYRRSKDYINLLRTIFGEDIEVVDPSQYENRHGNIDFYLNLIKDVDAVVYVPFLGFITAGVFDEVMYALRRRKRVYRLSGNKIRQIRDYKDIKEDYLDIEATRALYDALKSVDEYVLANELHNIMEEYLVDRREALKIFYEQKLDSYRNTVIKMDPSERWYHWWQENDNIYIPIDTRELKRLILQKMNEVQAKSLKDFALKFGLSEHRASYYRKGYLKERIKAPYVKGLKKISMELNIPYHELERKVIPGYPVDLANPYLWRLAAHMLNDGHLDKDLKDATYVNKDPVLHWYVKQNLEKIGGRITSMNFVEYGKGKYLKIESIIDARTARLLNEIGVPAGNKTINQPNIDFSKMDWDTWRYYVQVAFTEDGNAYLEANKEKYLKLKLELGRSIDITNHLDKKTVLNLPYGAITIKQASNKGLIDENLIYTILSNRPRLLEDEIFEFKRRHPDVARLFPKIKPKIIYKKKNNRVTIIWRFTVSNKKIITLFYNYYRMLPDSKKNEAFVARYKFYRQYGGRKIDKDIYKKYKKLIDKYPNRITKEYTVKKFYELSGENKDEK